MFKNILLGLGSAGVIGGGGYVIYNATRSGDDKSVEIESRKEPGTKEEEKDQSIGSDADTNNKGSSVTPSEQPSPPESDGATA